MSTWREMIANQAASHGDDITDLVVFPERSLWPYHPWSNEPQEGATEVSTLDVDFDAGYGSPHGPRFTAWTTQRVYFPVVYDGAEWVGSAPRNPCDEATEHVGGG
jgi:hypothetical protein